MNPNDRAPVLAAALLIVSAAAMAEEKPLKELADRVYGAAVIVDVLVTKGDEIERAVENAKFNATLRILNAQAERKERRRRDFETRLAGEVERLRKAGSTEAQLTLFQKVYRDWWAGEERAQEVKDVEELKATIKGEGENGG